MCVCECVCVGIEVRKFLCGTVSVPSLYVRACVCMKKRVEREPTPTQRPTVPHKEQSERPGDRPLRCNAVT